MTIKIKTLTVRNFMSIGQLTQAVDFTSQNLTLILGENQDQGGDGSKNGVGKCCGINTKINIRNTKTGEISELTIGELYNAATQSRTKQ